MHTSFEIRSVDNFSHSPITRRVVQYLRTVTRVPLDSHASYISVRLVYATSRVPPSQPISPAPGTAAGEMHRPASSRSKPSSFSVVRLYASSSHVLLLLSGPLLMLAMMAPRPTTVLVGDHSLASTLIVPGRIYKERQSMF